MAQIPVVSPSGASNPVKVRQFSDESGTPYIQIVQLGEGNDSVAMIDLLSEIRDELVALRIQHSHDARIRYEPAEAFN